MDSNLKNNVQAKTDDSIKNGNNEIFLSQMSHEKNELNLFELIDNYT